MKCSKNIVLLLAVFTSVFFSACSNNKSADEIENSPESVADAERNNAEKKIEIPEKFSKNINDVEFDMTIEIPKDVNMDELSKSTATLQAPDIEKAVNLFAAQKSISGQSEDTGIGENGNSFAMVYCSFDDGSALMIDNVLVYTTPFFENVHNAFRIEKTTDYNAHQFSQEQQFHFISPENAFENVLEKINGSGYELEDFDYTYFALDSETLKQEEMQRGKSGEELDIAGREWTGNDDSYYFFAEQIYDGIPVYYGDQNFPQDSVENRPIQALYSSRGIERLDVAKIYSFMPLEGKVQLEEFDAVAECVANKYGNILTGADYKAMRAKLYQMPIKDISGNYEVKIVWLFEVHESGIDSETGENFENVIYTFVDAETGEEVSI